MASDIWCYILVLKCYFVLLFIQNVMSNYGDDIAYATTSDFWQELLFFELLEPEDIAYIYKIKPAKDFGVSLNRTLHEVELVLTTPANGCSHFTNPRLIRGNIALIERGECSFVSKTLNAEHAGALVAVIMDSDVSNDDTLIDMVDDGTKRHANIPAFFILGRDGYMIRRSLTELNLESATINIPINATGLAVLPGQQPPWSLW